MKELNIIKEQSLESVAPKRTTDLPVYKGNITNIKEQSLESVAPKHTDSTLQLGYKEASSQGIDITKYNKYYKNGITLGLPQHVLEEGRAANQSGWQLLGNSVMQLGGTILGQTISGIGSVMNLGKTVIELGREALDPKYKADWDSIINDGLSGAFTQAGLKLEESTREMFPIYQTQQAQKGGFGGGMTDATWWASMFPTVGSAVASMFPVIGALRGVTMIGKGLASINTINKFGKALNKTGTFLNNKGTLTVLGSVLGAHMDASMEIAHGYDEQFQYAKSLGYSDEEARSFAATYASTAYTDAWLYGLAFNAIELNVLLKGTNKLNMTLPDVDRLTRQNIAGMAKQGSKFTGLTFEDASKTLANKGWKSYIRSGLKKTSNFNKVSLSEAIEEMRVDFALLQGELAAKKELGIYDERNNFGVVTQLADFMSDAANWDSFIWGGFGGMTMYGGRSLVNKAVYGKRNNEYAAKQYQLINDALQDTAATIEEFDGNLSMTPEVEQVVKEDGSVEFKVTSVNDPAQTIFIPLFNKLGQANAIEYGIDYLNSILNLSTEEIEETYGQGKQEVIKEILKEFEIAKDIYRKNRNVSWGSKFDTYIQNNISTIDYLKDYYSRKLDEVETNLKAKEVEFNTNTEKQEIALQELDASRLALEKEKQSALEKIQILKDKNDSHKSFIADEIIKSKRRELNISKVTLENQIAELEKNRANFKIDRDSYRRYYRALAKRINAETNQEKRFALIQELNELWDIRQNNKKENRVNTRRLYNLKQKLNAVNTNIDFIDSQYESENNKIDINEKEITNLESIITDIDSKLSDIPESKKALVEEYNRIKSEYSKAQEPNNITLENLRQIRQSLLFNVIELSNIQTNKQDYVDNLKKQYEKLEERDNERIRNQEENTKAEQENIQEDTEEEKDVESISIENKKDANNYQYTINKDGQIISFIKGLRKYDIGDTVRVNGKSDIIKNITIDDNDNLQITFAKAPNISVSEFNETPIDKNLLNLIDKFSDKYTLDGFDNNFIKLLEALNKDFKGKTFKAAFVDYTNDTSVSIARVRVLTGIIRNLEQVNYHLNDVNENASQEEQTKQKDDILKLYTDTLFTLTQLLALNNKAIRHNALLNYIGKYINIVLLNKTSSINDEITNKYIPQLIKSITDTVSDYGVYNTQENRFEIITEYGLDELLSKIDDNFKSFKEILANQLYQKYELEDFSDLETELDKAKNTIDEVITNAFKLNIKNRLYPVIKSIETYSQHINDIINNKSKDENAFELFSIFSELYGDETFDAISKLSKAINSVIQNYIDTGGFATQETLETLKSYNTIIEDDIDLENDLANLLPEEIELFNKSGLKELLDLLNDSYDFINNAIALQNSTNANEISILRSIETLVNLNESDEYNLGNIYDESYDGVNDIYARTDWRFYITPSDYIAIKALNDIVARFKLLNKYDDKHKITYSDILDVIYQSENGEEKLDNLYKPIFTALVHLSDASFLQKLKSELKANVDEDSIQNILKLLNTIQQNVQSPLISIRNLKTTTNSTRNYLDANDNITKAFIDDFRKTHKRFTWKQEVHDGVIVPNNAIWDALNSVYDSRTKTIQSKVTIDGVEFTTQELYQALQSLSTGDELIHKQTNDNQTIELYTTINGKLLKVGTINVQEAFTFGNLRLSRKIADNIDVNVYDSFLGTSQGLKPTIQRFITQVSNSQKLFDGLREYYKEYYKARLQGIQNTEPIIKRLDDLLDKIGKINVPAGAEYNLTYNALLESSNYNSDTENNPIINHDAIFNVIEPLFYNVDISSIDSYLRWGGRIKATYENLNARLSMSFNSMQAIIDTLNSDPNAKIKISYLNKTSLSFASDTRINNNVEDNITKQDVIINGKQTKAIKLVTKQANGNEEVISSLTENKRINNPYSEDTLLDSQRHFQISFEIKLNNDDNGVSYIPAKRNSLGRTITPNNEYSKLATAKVIDTILKIGQDRFLTNLAINQSSNSKVTMYVASPEFKATEDEILRKLLNDTSEAIIIDSNSDNGTIPWFNVSGLYINRFKDGSAEMTKDIEFISVIRNRYAYGYKIRFVYEYSDATSQPTKIKQIKIQRTRTNANRFRGGANNVSPGFSQIELAKYYKDADRTYRIDDKYKWAIINVTENTNLEQLFSSSLFKPIFAGMQRGLSTEYNGDSYTLTSKATGESFTENSFNQIDGVNIIESTESQLTNKQTTKGKVFKGKYRSAILEWAKKQGLYDGKTTFDSIQDFYLKTDALTTGAVGIKDASTGEVFTNYQLNGVSPKIYINIETDTVQAPKKELKEINAIQEAKSIIQRIASPIYTSKENFFNKLKENGVITKQTLIDLGIVQEDTPENVVKEIIKFYEDTYGDIESIPLLYVDSPEDYKIKTGRILTEPVRNPNYNPNATQEEIENAKKENIDITQPVINIPITKETFSILKGEYNKNQGNIVLYSNLFTKASVTISDIGNTLTHESLHFRILKDLKSGKINESIISELNDLLTILNSINENTKSINEEDKKILKKYLEVINSANEDAYHELITYALTDSTFANILNRIEVTNKTTKTKRTIWARLIDALLKILGISEVTPGSALATFKDIVVNNINSGRTKKSNTSSASHVIPSVPLPGRSRANENVTPQVEPDIITQVTETTTSNPDVDIQELDIDTIGNIDDILSSRDVLRERPGREASEMQPTIPTESNNKNNPLNNGVNSVYWQSNKPIVTSIKETYTDENNLKIC